MFYGGYRPMRNTELTALKNRTPSSCAQHDRWSARGSRRVKTLDEHCAHQRRGCVALCAAHDLANNEFRQVGLAQPVGARPDPFSYLAACAACRAVTSAVMEFRRMRRQEGVHVPQAADEAVLARLEQSKRR